MRQRKSAWYRPIVTALLLAFATGVGWGQDAPVRFVPPTGRAPETGGGIAAEPASPLLSSAPVPVLAEGDDPVAKDDALRQPEHRPPQVRLDYTWLAPGGHHGFGVNDVELSATVAVPIVATMAPVLITPGFATHFWAGPQSGYFPGRPDLPAQAYDATLDLGWRPQFARWLFADFGVTPGVYSDFHQLISESFRPHARALGIVAFSQQWQVVAGILYVNRLHIQVLPAGGVIWSPSEFTHCELLFPQPKVSHQLVAFGLPHWWAFVMGAYGGGTWTVERANGATDLTDYRDQRLLVGLEWQGPTGVTGRLETGYVFSRSVQYTSATPGLKPDNTFLMRVGFTF